MNNLLTLNFWFRLHPISLSPFFFRSFFILFSLCVIFGAIATMVARRRKEDMFLVRTYKKIATMFTTMGWIGMLFLWFSYEELFIFGARFWFLIWGLGVCAWVLSIAYYVKIHVPKEREQHRSNAAVNKYLPKKKRR